MTNPRLLLFIFIFLSSLRRLYFLDAEIAFVSLNTNLLHAFYSGLFTFGFLFIVT